MEQYVGHHKEKMNTWSLSLKNQYALKPKNYTDVR